MIEERLEAILTGSQRASRLLGSAPEVRRLSHQQEDEPSRHQCKHCAPAPELVAAGPLAKRCQVGWRSISLGFPVGGRLRLVQVPGRYRYERHACQRRQPWEAIWQALWDGPTARGRSRNRGRFTLWPERIAHAFFGLGGRIHRARSP